VPAIRLGLLSGAHVPAVERMLADDGVLRFTRVPEPQDLGCDFAIRSRLPTDL
jgi:hypothetical protein